MQGGRVEVLGYRMWENLCKCAGCFIFRLKKAEMKKVLLAIATLFIAGSSFAQLTEPDYHFEVGIYGGIAPFITPNKPYDKGTDNLLPAFWSVNGHYNISEHLQVGLDASVTQWQAHGNSYIYNLNDSAIGAVTSSYLYADRAWSLTARLNGVIPHYDRFHQDRSNFYYGIAVGVAFTINDGNIAYDQYLQQKGENFRYVSAFNYESMTGYTFGLQAGWNYYFTNTIGFNVEFAPRFTHFSGIDSKLASRNSQFDIYNFPLTIGFRKRF